MKHYMRLWKHGDVNCVIKDISATTDKTILIKRFEEKLEREPMSGCWLWTGTYRKPSSSYCYTNGQFTINKKHYSAHRVAYMLYVGEIKNGAHVLHRCNNSMCVNPAHLYLGDHAQNMRDMAKANRSGQSNLTNEDVLTIFSSTEKSSVLAARYGVDRCSIKRIRSGKTRRAITGL